MPRAVGFLRSVVERFRNDEDGAMTVEWVAIAAAVVVGAVAVTYNVLDNLPAVANTVGTSLTTVPQTPPPNPFVVP
jgi:Flp pilus assembly pilin Flp